MRIKSFDNLKINKSENRSKFVKAYAIHGAKDSFCWDTPTFIKLTEIKKIVPLLYGYLDEYSMEMDGDYSAAWVYKDEAYLIKMPMDDLLILIDGEQK